MRIPLQYSLRILFVCTCLIALLTARLSQHFRSLEQAQIAIAALASRASSVEITWADGICSTVDNAPADRRIDDRVLPRGGCSDVRAVHVTLMPKSPVQWSALAAFDQLEELHVFVDSQSDGAGAALNDDCLAAAASCPNLRVISIFALDCEVSNKGLARLGALRRLEKFELTSTASITAEGLSHLRQLPRLKCLGLAGCSIDVDDVSEISNFAALEELNLSVCGLHDSSLSPLRGCRRLHTLDVGCNPIGDKSIPHIAACGNLKELSLNDTHISDASLAVIAESMRLKRIHITATTTTAEGESRLTAQLPFASIRTTDRRSSGLRRLLLSWMLRGPLPKVHHKASSPASR